MKRLCVLATAALLAVWAIPAGAATVSTNPDVPATLKVNTIIGHMNQGDGKGFDNYYTFRAGPGTVKVRATARAGTDAADLEITLSDPDGNSLTPTSCTGNCNGEKVVTAGQGDNTTTAAFTLTAAATLVVHVHGTAQYYHSGAHPTYRISFDGAVKLNKTAKPLRVNNH